MSLKEEIIWSVFCVVSGTYMFSFDYYRYKSVVLAWCGAAFCSGSNDLCIRNFRWLYFGTDSLDASGLVSGM
jgi:hypothetical protein